MSWRASMTSCRCNARQRSSDALQPCSVCRTGREPPGYNVTTFYCRRMAATRCLSTPRSSHMVSDWGDQIWGQLHYINSNYTPITHTNYNYTPKIPIPVTKYQFHSEITVCVQSYHRHTQCQKITPISEQLYLISAHYGIEYNIQRLFVKHTITLHMKISFPEAVHLLIQGQCR